MIKYISILPITIYLIYIVVEYGVQKSISESYYRLSKGEKFLFFFALIGTSLNMILGFALENNNPLQVSILFFAGLGICYTASAAEFKKDKITKTWHMAGAFGGYILGYVFIVSVYGWDSLWFIIPSLMLIGFLKLLYKKNPYTIDGYDNRKGEFVIIKEVGLKDHFIWWAEIIGLITIYLATIL